MDENSEAQVPPTEEVEENNPVQAGEENAPVQTPPPAASLVMHGTKTERELQLERELEETRRRQRELETTVSEKERDIQELKKIPVPRASKPKRSRLFPTIINSDDDDE